MFVDGCNNEVILKINNSSKKNLEKGTEFLEICSFIWTEKLLFVLNMYTNLQLFNKLSQKLLREYLILTAWGKKQRDKRRCED